MKSCFEKEPPSELKDYCISTYGQILRDISQNYRNMRLNLALSEPKARLDAIRVEDRPLYKLKRKISHPFTGDGLVSPPLSDDEMIEAEAIWDFDYLNSVEEYREKKISQLSKKQKEWV